jgi:hypothetical protein
VFPAEFDQIEIRHRETGATSFLLAMNLIILHRIKSGNTNGIALTEPTAVEDEAKGGLEGICSELNVNPNFASLYASSHVEHVTLTSCKFGLKLTLTYAKLG